MQTIQSSDTIFDQLITSQLSADGDSFRPLIYVLHADVPGGRLLFNTLSCELLLLEGDEANDIEANDYLRSHRFVVPEEFDDRKFADDYRSLLRLMTPEPAGKGTYTILTTTDCNARCFYCYELGRSRIPMTDATAHKVAEYIHANYCKLKEENEDASVRISWFGGEPLYNVRVIDIICNDLKEKGVRCHSTMVSNAYLFSQENVDKAATLWNLKNVQVTLDGTRDVYNRAKAFIYKDTDAFGVVMDSIGRLLKADIHVTVRMNIDMHNAVNLLQLVDVLAERFAGEKNLSCYSHPLFEFAGNGKAHVRSDVRRRKVFECQQALMDKIIEKGLQRQRRLPKRMVVNRCMADNDACVTILPDGHIGLCEHYTDSDFIAHIDTPEIVDAAMVASFRETWSDLDICNGCAYYPHCVRLKKCEEAKACYPEMKEQYLQDMRKSMLAAYEKWHKKQSEQAEGLETDNDDILNDDVVTNPDC